MDIIEFADECVPYNIMASDGRFIICSRHLDVNEDYDLLKHRVDMGSYISIYSAYEDNKDNPIYTIVDRLNNVRSCDNMIFETIDYFNKKDCEKALAMLNNYELELSRRSKIELKIKYIKMEHIEALEYCNKIKWKMSTCSEGEECWCRIIEPVEEVRDSEGNEMYIIGSGSVMKESAEHIVKVHNAYIESLK